MYLYVLLNIMIVSSNIKPQLIKDLGDNLETVLLLLLLSQTYSKIYFVVLVPSHRTMKEDCNLLKRCKVCSRKSEGH